MITHTGPNLLPRTGPTVRYRLHFRCGTTSPERTGTAADIARSVTYALLPVARISLTY